MEVSESSDSSLIDVEELNFSDDQTWLNNRKAGKEHMDIGEYVSDVSSYLKNAYDSGDYRKVQADLVACLEAMSIYDALQAPQSDKQKFDSRTFTRPKRRSVRPSLHAVVESGTRTITKGPSQKSSNIIRHKTFTLDPDGVINPVLKDYALRRSEGNTYNKENQSLDNRDVPLHPEEHQASSSALSKPIDINLSEPVHNLHNTFSRLSGAAALDRSLSIGRGDDSFMNVSPPSMVSSIAMDASGNFNSGSFMSRKGSMSSQKDLFMRVSDGAFANKDVCNFSLASSMANSIMDEKEMNTSFLSQTPCLDNESLLGSLPLSLASSFNSTIASNQFLSRPKLKDNNMAEESVNKSYLGLRPSLNNNKISPRNNIMGSSYIVERETMDESLEKDDDLSEFVLREIAGRPSLNLTMDKKELSEIISARQKLSLARSSLPSQKTEEPRLKTPYDESRLLNRISPIKNGTYRKLTPSMRTTLQNGDQKMDNISYTTIKVVDKGADSMEKLDESELSTSNKSSNKDSSERTMACSSDSLEGGATGSSISGGGSPPEIAEVHRLAPAPQQTIKYHSVTSTPQSKRPAPSVFHMNALSPIVDPGLEDSQILDSTLSNPAMQKSNSSSLGRLDRDFADDTVVVKRQSALRSPEKRQSMYAGSVRETKPLELKSACPPVRKSGLPTSKLRQYSSHKELSKIAGASNLRYPSSGLALRGVSGLRESARSGVYASNPALSPTAPNHNALGGGNLVRKGSYTIMGGSASMDKDVDHIPSSTFKNESKMAPATRQLRQIPPSDNRRLLNRPREMRESLLPTSNHQQDTFQMSTGHYGLPLKGRHNIPTAIKAISVRPSIGGSLQALNKGSLRPPSINKPTSQSAKELSQAVHRAENTAPVIHRSSVAAPQSVNQVASKPQVKSSGLPRPSRLPAPRRSLRPPSTYSLPQTTGDDYDCY